MMIGVVVTLLARWWPVRPPGLLVIYAFIVLSLPLPLHLLPLVPDLARHADFELVLIVCDLVLLRWGRQASENFIWVFVGGPVERLIVPAVSVGLRQGAVEIISLAVIVSAATQAASLVLLFGRLRRPVWVPVLRPWHFAG